MLIKDLSKSYANWCNFPLWPSTAEGISNVSKNRVSDRPVFYTVGAQCEVPLSCRILESPKAVLQVDGLPQSCWPDHPEIWPDSILWNRLVSCWPAGVADCSSIRAIVSQCNLITNDLDTPFCCWVQVLSHDRRYVWAGGTSFEVFPLIVTFQRDITRSRECLKNSPLGGRLSAIGAT